MIRSGARLKKFPKEIEHYLKNNPQKHFKYETPIFERNKLWFLEEVAFAT